MPILSSPSSAITVLVSPVIERVKKVRTTSINRESQIKQCKVAAMALVSQERTSGFVMTQLFCRRSGAQNVSRLRDGFIIIRDHFRAYLPGTTHAFAV